MFRSGNPQTFVPGAAVAVGRFVQLESDGQVIHVAARGTQAIGVALEAAAAADGPPIAVALIDGQTVVEMESGEAIAVGEPVTSHTDGSAMDGDTTGDAIHGRALTATAADGEFLSVLLVHAPVLAL